jgi:UDP-N-acetylmuramate--alanine ligase
LDLDIKDLKKYKKIHLIGIGGISMSAVAETLHNWGYIVTGSDACQSEITDKLNAHGITTTIGHDLINSKNADLIVYSAAIKETDPEMVIAKENSIPLVGRGEFVGLLTKMYKDTICVAGTHGKTTTTSMLSVCFIDAALDPSIEVGAILNKIDGNYRIGKSDYFILESCEYNANFLNFHPKVEIILNIDNDHLDFYKTFDNIVKAFNDFAKILKPDGLLVTNADDKNAYELTKVVKSKAVSYGIENENANYLAKNIDFDSNGFASFDVFKNNEFLVHISLSVAGKHNILNSLACIAVCDFYKLNLEKVAKSLKEFTGASRRLEYKGTLKNKKVSVFDDYGHHPTEITATAKAIEQKKYNESWVVFQPHTYSRTQAHLDSFAKSLIEFDHIILVDIYAAREKNTIGISSNDLAKKMKELGKEALYMPDFNNVVDYLKENVKDNDIILTLGAGTVTEIGPMLVK